MTSELEALKTNEFLRRRKLRIQQVREQSKDIAKKIRQRAKVEALRQVESLDSRKAKEYLEHQEKFVRRLELLYARGIKHIGTGHKNAEQVKVREDSTEKADLSKSRGKDAAAELKRKKQEKLDIQKKILDRKLQAREAANEISKEKSTTVANKLLAKSSSSKFTLGTVKNDDAETETKDLPVMGKQNNEEVHLTEESEGNMQEKSLTSNELQPNIPTLSLPNNDQDGSENPKLSGRDISSEKRSRPNLFAVSDEMPPSLRGSLAEVYEETNINKPSMTRVSEYILGRDLRLREANSALSKKSSEDLLNIKQTILKSRASKTEGTGDISIHSSVCRVVDEQVVPVPSWQAEMIYDNCSCHKLYQRTSTRCKQCINVQIPQINKTLSSGKPETQNCLHPRPVLRGHSPSSRQYLNVLNSQISETFSSTEPENQHSLHPRSNLRGRSPSSRQHMNVPNPQITESFSSIEPEVQLNLHPRLSPKGHISSSRQYVNVPNTQINEMFSSIEPETQRGLLPSPVLRGPSPFRRRKVSPHTPFSGKHFNESQPLESAEQRRNLVKMYNHSTRDTQDRPCADKKLVTRDSTSEEDAYSLALRESSIAVIVKEPQHQTKVQVMRNKVAVSKETVDKEYKDTMAFLKKMPKDSRPITAAYRDEKRQQAQYDKKQRLMQNEFKNIQKSSRKPSPVSKTGQRKSPTNFCSGDREFQYSWMPVPDGDEGLVVHNIPTDTNNGKGSKVKFASVDSYHEYRSRHKHTPPTKDTAGRRATEETVTEKDSDYTESSSVASDASSVDISSVQSKGDHGKIGYNVSDLERLIINKLLDQKIDAESKSKYWKLLMKIAKNGGSSNEYTNGSKKTTRSDVEKCSKDLLAETGKAESRRSTDQVTEGVNEKNENGESLKSMCVSDSQHNNNDAAVNTCPERSCQVISKDSPGQEYADKPPAEKSYKKCKCKARHSADHSANTPRLSLQPKTLEKCSDKERTCLKLVDDTGNETGKFYIGATGFLKDDDYEVIIQLRKKDGSKHEKKEDVEVKESATGLQEQISVINIQSNTQSVEDRNRLSDSALSTGYAQPSTGNDGKAVSTAGNAQPSTLHIQPIADNSQPITVCDSIDLQPKTQSVEDHNSLFNIAQSCFYYTQPSSGIIQSSSKAQSRTVSQGTTSTLESFKPKLQEQSGNAEETEDTNDSNNNKAELPKSNIDIGTKADTVPRMATSTSTQTTLGSPVQRTDIHMSSSTSTAYMSPPDTILPHFLKCETTNYLFVKNDIDFDPRHHGVGREKKQEQEYCDEKRGCKSRYSPHQTKPINQPKEISPVNKNFKKMQYPVNGTHRQLKERPKTTQSTYDKQLKAPSSTPKSAVSRQLKPPPNLARSPLINTRRANIPTPSQSPSPQSYLSRSYRTDVTSNNSCIKSTKSKNVAASAPKTCNSRSNKKVPMAPKRSSNVARDKASKNTNSIPKKNIDKVNLKPIVKGYVDKLLTLNRAGMKAVEIMHVDCSTVSTPASSIIDVPPNIDENDLSTAMNLVPKISLEQLKQSLIECLIQNNRSSQKKGMPIKMKSLIHLPRKKPVHKVKSLNISKHFFHIKSDDTQGAKSTEPTSTSSTKDDCHKTNKAHGESRKIRSKSSPSPRRKLANELKCKSNSCETVRHVKGTKKKDDSAHFKKSVIKNCRATNKSHKYNENDTPDLPSPDVSSLYRSKSPQSISTQTKNELNFMKIAKGKLQNMEKIADLTEKCTLRLSNLAKVLNEVRKSKSAHNLVTDSAADIHKDDWSSPTRVVNAEHHQREDIQLVEQGTGDENHKEDIAVGHHKQVETIPKETAESRDRATSYSLEYTSFLTDIPKPQSRSPVLGSPGNTSEVTYLKNRGKPPPALSRKILKHTKDVVPHELSTVVEVDSPLSMKHRTPSNGDQVIRSQHIDAGGNEPKSPSQDLNPDLLQTNVNKEQLKEKSDSLNSSKIQMMDLKQFNDIMLKPFMSIEEYSKQCTTKAFDDGLKINSHPKPADLINEDLSSYHSESSLPDVIAELLKRNVINEPFKFDLASNANSMSESTISSLSLLALSKIRKENKPQVKLDKPDSSDTMSVSSNPDLENAFKRLGMGWASSTLKKTKERLALSTSSNSSCCSSSLSHFKFNNGKHGEIVVPVSDTVSSATSSSKKKEVEQQTSHSKSMTVKQFLAKELANKITFTHTPRREEAEEEFVSLFETKVPENMKDSEVIEKSGESARSGNNARARTSTPLQIFRSATYHSTSESGSNGLFSNADDLSSVKGTSNSNKNHSTSDKDDLTIPNYSLVMKKTSDCSVSD